MKFFVHNSFHHGDVLLTRVIIDAIKKKYPNSELLLQCCAKSMYLWADYNVEIFDTPTQYVNASPTSECPKDFIFFNAWFGTYQDIIDEHGLTHKNQILTINRQMPDHKYDLELVEHAFLNVPEVYDEYIPNAILVENGKAQSGQCGDYINEHLNMLALDFPQYNFLCSSNPYENANKSVRLLPNIIDCSNLNLFELSNLSNKCIAFITKASGVNACTYTKHNVGKPRFFFGYDFPWKIWDNSAINVRSYDELTASMRNSFFTNVLDVNI